MSALISSPSVPTLDELTVEVGVDATLAYERGRTDINFFAGLALPDVVLTALPFFYIVCFQLIVIRATATAGEILRFALGLPRGHAKTTFIKIMLAWLIAYDKASFIAVVCSTEKNAQNLVSDLSSILGSPNMERVYGLWHNNLFEDNKESKKCAYHSRVVMLEARGAITSVRGLNQNNSRPDVILCDDVQTAEGAQSETENKKLMLWLVGTLFKAIAVRGDRLIIYIGNMYNVECILNQFKESPEWISLITGAILEDGTPLWPELHSIKSLMSSFLHDDSLGLADVWYAEVMNDPKNAKLSLIHDTLPNCPYEKVVYDGVFITIDPAGYRKASDDNVIVGHGVYDGKGIVERIEAGKFTPQETIKIALSMALELGATVIGIESVSYQQTLKFWMEYFIIEMEISGIQVVELSPHGRSKESRIRAFIQELYGEEYYLGNPAVKGVFSFQAKAYQIGKANNKDDILDGCAYGIDMRTDYWHLIGNNLNQREVKQLAKVVDGNTPF